MTGSKWDDVLQTLTETFKSRFCHIQNQDYVKFCFEIKEIRETVEGFLRKLNLPNELRPKSDEVSIKRRIEGNQKFSESNYTESLALYTKSIFLAQSDECLALGYSNRSLVLYKMEHYLESLQDVSMALTSGYKDELGKLLLRKVRCLVKMGDIDKGREILADAIKKNYPKGSLSILQRELSILKENKFDKPLGMHNYQLPELAGGENKNFASASNYISVFYNKKKGRHVLATSDINMGDVLIVEKPFAFVLIREACHGCCKQTVAPIPCEKCSVVFYCSPECRSNFWKSVHSNECGFSELFKCIGIAHLSLRIVLSAFGTFDELKNYLCFMQDPEPHQTSVKLNSKNYESVYKLITNIEKYEACDLFQYVTTALLLALYLRNYTSYFNKSSDDEDLKQLVSVLWRHILQLICNGHAITAIYSSDSRQVMVVDKAEERLGTAIYPSASMMNHSCESSIFNSFYNNILIVRASKSIKKGEEVFNCYGPHARRMKKAERQEILLRQYFFQCKCQPCLQKFDIQDKVTAFKCFDCSGPLVATEESANVRVCLKCAKRSETSDELLQKQNLLYALLEEGNQSVRKDVNLALSKFLQSWRIGREIFYKFHKDLSYAADEVARCLALIGNFKMCIMFLKCCILSVEERFGSFSIELANELRKLGDAITNHCNELNRTEARRIAQEGIRCYEKAHRIICLLYGRHNENLREIESSISVLLGFAA